MKATEIISYLFVLDTPYLSLSSGVGGVGVWGGLGWGGRK